MKKILTLPNRVIFHAFSLVELLMALLVASLLMAALAPVMTKKYSENVNITAINSSIPKTWCAYANDSTNLINFTDESTACLVPDSTYSANAIIVSGGGGGGGATDLVEGAETNLLSAGNSIPINGKVKSLTIKIRGGGASAGSGGFTNYYNIPRNQADCINYTNNITDTAGNLGSSSRPVAMYDAANKICVTRYNQIVSGKCVSYVYESVARTTCLWNDAVTACNNLNNKYSDGLSKNWRLPTLAELSKWSGWVPVTSGSNLAKDLLLCDTSAASNGAAYCPRKTNEGMGSPGWVHSVDAHPGLPSNCLNGDAHRANALSKGSWIDSGYLCTIYAVSGSNFYYYDHGSTRCVSDKVHLFSAYSGGKGTLGTYLELKVPEEILLYAFKSGSGKINAYPGAKVSGGKAPNSASTGTNKTQGGNDGIDGNESKVIISTNEEILWMVDVPGGISGFGAASDKDGENASPDNSPYCYYYNKFDTAYNTNSATGTRLKCSTLKNLLSGQITIGAVSGTGGSCNANSTSGQITCTDGSDGEEGMIQAIYKPSYPGIGGNGGSAGILLHVKNFQVRPKDLIKVQIGHGGNGGSANDKGGDGGNSFIEIVRNNKSISKYEVSGGKGGNSGKPAIPSENKDAQPGEFSDAGSILDATKNKLTLHDEYFPKTNEETKLSIGSKSISSADFMTSAGGNGGLNYKISPLAKTSGKLNGKPCGGLSTNEIITDKDDESKNWICSAENSPLPLELSRALYPDTLRAGDILDIITNYAPGATGGGGGGWKYDFNPKASNGAKGMGGYVIIYFGDWSDEAGQTGG